MSLNQSMAVVKALHGKSIASGSFTPLADAETIVTGLSLVDCAIASIAGIPIATHSVSIADKGDQAGAPAAGSIIIRTRKTTDTTLTLPIASSGTELVTDWIAIGDA